MKKTYKYFEEHKTLMFTPSDISKDIISNLDIKKTQNISLPISGKTNININKFKITSTDPTLDESIKVGFHETLYTDGISTCIAVSLMTRLEDGKDPN